MKFQFKGILDDKRRRAIQLRVIGRYLLGFGCLILVLVILYISSGDKLFVGVLASVITVLTVEIMRYWFNYPFNRSVLDRFCKELVTRHSKELESVVNFVKKYDSKKDIPTESFTEILLAFFKIGGHLEGDIAFELQSRMRMDLITRMRADFWILQFKSRQDIIGLIAYLLCRYNSWHPRAGFTYPRGDRKAGRVAGKINRNIVKRFQKKYGKRYGKKIANHIFSVEANV